LRDEEPKSTRLNKENWENKLWAFIKQSEGTNCPLRKSCNFKHGCPGTNSQLASPSISFNDEDFLIDESILNKFPDYRECGIIAPLFGIIEQIANQYSTAIASKGLPVPIEKIDDFFDDIPVEIRLVPLKHAHGAVWRLKDTWVIHLNEKDSERRKRFTLYHELFHVLTYNELSFRYREAGRNANNEFVEMLADLFSGLVVTPLEVVREKWPEIRDIKKMAAFFGVPDTVMYCGLKYTKLI
jgi:hypothetical protein